MQLPLFKSDALNKIFTEVEKGYTFQMFKSDNDYVAELYLVDGDLPIVGYSSVDPMQALKRLFEMKSETDG